MRPPPPLHHLSSSSHPPIQRLPRRQLPPRAESPPAQSTGPQPKSSARYYLRDFLNTPFHDHQVTVTRQEEDRRKETARRKRTGRAASSFKCNQETPAKTRHPKLNRPMAPHNHTFPSSRRRVALGTALSAPRSRQSRDALRAGGVSAGPSSPTQNGLIRSDSVGFNPIAPTRRTSANHLQPSAKHPPTLSFRSPLSGLRSQQFGLIGRIRSDLPHSAQPAGQPQTTSGPPPCTRLLLLFGLPRQVSTLVILVRSSRIRSNALRGCATSGMSRSAYCTEQELNLPRSGQPAGHPLATSSPRPCTRLLLLFGLPLHASILIILVRFGRIRSNALRGCATSGMSRSAYCTEQELNLPRSANPPDSLKPPPVLPYAPACSCFSVSPFRSPLSSFWSDSVGFGPFYPDLPNPPDNLKPPSILRSASAGLPFRSPVSGLATSDLANSQTWLISNNGIWVATDSAQ
jgi:hypothetical protein